MSARCSVKCHAHQAETNDLWVPANAEIVLEGEISLTETALEGPIGSITAINTSRAMNSRCSMCVR